MSMKIVIATPFFPPDIGEQALYVKELSKRLSYSHDVTVVTYARLPEKVEGVSFVSVDKRRPLFIRLLHYTFVLWKTTRDTDILYAQNGASVELPAGLIAIFTRRPLVMHIGDKVAHKRAVQHILLRLVENFAFWQARSVVVDMPMKKPEILPWKPVPQKELTEYNKSWNIHMTTLKNIFKHAQ